MDNLKKKTDSLCVYILKCQSSQNASINGCIHFFQKKIHIWYVVKKYLKDSIPLP